MSTCVHAPSCRFHEHDEGAEAEIEAAIRHEVMRDLPGNPHASDLLNVLEKWTGHPLSFSEAEEFSRILASNNFRIARIR